MWHALAVSAGICQCLTVLLSFEDQDLIGMIMYNVIVEECFCKEKL